MELEHLTIGGLHETIATAEAGGLIVDREMLLVAAELHRILRHEMETIGEDNDPNTIYLSETAISDLIDPLEKLRNAQARVEARK